MQKYGVVVLSIIVLALTTAGLVHSYPLTEVEFISDATPLYLLPHEL